MISFFFKKKKFKQTIKKKKPNYQHFFKKKKTFFLKKGVQQVFLYTIKKFCSQHKYILLTNYLGFIKFNFYINQHKIFTPYSDLGMFKKIFDYNNFFTFLCLGFKGMVGSNLITTNGGKIAKASKSFFFIKSVGHKFIKLLYPSKKEVLILKYNNSVFENRQYTFSKKKKIVVRGIAKNPVDHPNGGNSNTKQPLQTPWAKIAKKGK